MQIRRGFALLALLLPVGAGCAGDEVDPDPPGTTSEALAASSMSGEVSAAVVTELGVNLTAGQTVVFQTTALSAGADPVMSLLSPGNVEVAADDNGASTTGKNALIVYTPTVSGTHLLIVRSKTALTGGSCTVARNGTPVFTGVTFSGGPRLVSSLRTGESLETVRLPNGAGPAHAIYVLKGNGIGLERRSVAGGTAGGARIGFDPGPGSRMVVFAVRAGNSPGTLGWVRNDAGIAGHDGDGDGLGHELEAAIGTCTSLTGTATGPDGNEFDCTRAADARDTDGDGIGDGWELLGRRDLSPHQPLPLWGANPRHKDLFLEVDFMQRCVGEVDQRMSAERARQMAATYGDTVEPVDAITALARGTMLRNPDGKPGISLHLDTGRSPERPEDATVHGNWGGHNLVMRASAPAEQCVGQSAAAVWQTQMATARRGIFHYALAYPGGGGSSSEYVVHSSWGMDSPVTPAHELGHSLGLGHSGHGGNPGDTDANCKPTYPSVMNYAFYDRAHQLDAPAVSFADGLTRPAIDNLALREQGFTSDPRYLAHLRDVFGYQVELAAGHVDWNRDGVYSPGTVRAYANSRPGGSGCEWTRYNQRTVAGASGKGSPALAHLGDRTYVFDTDGATTQLRRAYTTRLPSMATNLACPRVGDCAGVTFTAPAPIALGAGGGVAAVALQVAGQATILVVTVDDAGQLWETRLTLVAGVEQWTTPVRIGTALARGEPALAADGSFSAYLAYAGPDGLVRTDRFAAGAWQGARLAQTVDGVPAGQPPVALPAIASFASPGLGFVYMPGQAGRGIYGAFADGDGTLRIWKLDPASGLWTQVDPFDAPARRIRRKPSLVWVPRSPATDAEGTLYLGYLEVGNLDLPFSLPGFQRSYARTVNGQLEQRLGLTAPFDNFSGAFEGWTLSYDPAVDINLRSVDVEGGQVVVRPNADGITGFPQRNISDWEWLAVTTCRTLINPSNGRIDQPDPLLSNPIKCHPYVYVPN